MGACNGLVFLTNAAALLICLLALGNQRNMATVFVALIMASIVVTLRPILLGFGSLEATSTGMDSRTQGAGRSGLPILRRCLGSSATTERLRHEFPCGRLPN